MRKQTVQGWQSLLLVTIAAFIVLGASSDVLAQKKGVGAKYGARDPQECAQTKATSSKPSMAEAVASYICNKEGEFGESLFLVDEVQITAFGKGQRPNPNRRLYSPAPDFDSLEYDIRGNYKQYQCGRLLNPNVRERNCNLSTQTNALGVCYKDTFGSWVCTMASTNYDDFTKVEAPRGKSATKDAPVKDRPDTTDKPDANTGEKKTDKPVATDGTGFVKPDFSEMEKYFEIIRYEYDFAKSTMYLVVKIKKRIGVNGWLFNYYDADDVKLDCYGCSSVRQSGDDSAVGEVVKIYVGTPREKLMKEVKRITVIKDF